MNIYNYVEEFYLLEMIKTQELTSNKTNLNNKTQSLKGSLRLRNSL